jgi:hypothetical protein
MARIKINDLPSNMKISTDEMRRVRGGTFKVYPKVEIEAPFGPATSLIGSYPSRSLDVVYYK